MTQSIQRQPVYNAARLKRRGMQLLLFLYAAATVGCLALVIGPAYNDHIIDADPGRALARVTAVTNTKTVVEYQDETGLYHSPKQGLLYPSGLGPGQRVWITYAKTDPELAKVEGRRWTLAIIPAFSVWIGLQVLAASIAILLRLGTLYRPREQRIVRLRFPALNSADASGTQLNDEVASGVQLDSTAENCAQSNAGLSIGVASDVVTATNATTDAAATSAADTSDATSTTSTNITTAATEPNNGRPSL